MVNTTSLMHCKQDRGNRVINASEARQNNAEKFENATINVYFEFVFKENMSSKNHVFNIVASSFWKTSVLKMFSAYSKKRFWCIPAIWRALLKSFGLKMFSVRTKIPAFLCFEQRFLKATLSWRISVDGRPNRRNKAPLTWRISVDGRPNRRNKAPLTWRISVDGRPNRRNKAPLTWRISVDGRPNRRNKAPLTWRISVDGRPNRRNKAPLTWRISVDGRPNRRNKAPLTWRISVDGRPNRRNKAAFSRFSGVKRTRPDEEFKQTQRLLSVNLEWITAFQQEFSNPYLTICRTKNT